MSGNLGIAKLKMVRVKLKGIDEPVTLTEMQFTPSMKSEIYGGSIVFTDDGVFLLTKYRCDCPNGC